MAQSQSISVGATISSNHLGIMRAISLNDQCQRQAPAADEAEFVSERIPTGRDSSGFVAATLKQQHRNIVDYVTAACDASMHGQSAPLLLPTPFVTA